MTLILTLISGIAWSVVYLALIKTGFKYKTYGMPLFALALNIAWEGLNTFDELFIHPALNSIQTYVNLVWFLLDVVITYTYFKYGREYFPKRAQSYFVPFSLLAFAASFGIQLAFYLSFAPLQAAQYSAFLQNAAMSILFLNMLFNRSTTRGQSMTVAIAKWLGTLAPVILMGVYQHFNLYIIICGVICSVFDILYITFLARFKKMELTLND